MYETVNLDQERNALAILDQTLLPSEEKMLYLTTQEEIFTAISRLQVRGAPAIGDAAAIGLYLASLDIEETDKEAFFLKLRRAKDYLASSRPTAVNLFWALDRMEHRALEEKGRSICEIRQALKEEALRIREEDIDCCRAIGEYGRGLLRPGDGILTHCNAGALATAKYGTATAPIYRAQEEGYHLKVYVDETRPLLQGARLTAYELQKAGVDVTLICDNMAAALMQQKKVQAVLVGCDRVAANGDTANKIGTSAVAILAKYYSIPFYVCAPFSTIDPKCPTGAQIPVEERAPEEITQMWYQKKMAPEGIGVYNPAFDVTDHQLITAFITEKGIFYPPFSFEGGEKDNEII